MTNWTMPGAPPAMSQALNVPGQESCTQGGLVELIADLIKRPLTLVHIETRPGATPVPLGQNLVYDCHAVYTTTKVRSQLGIRPRYTLAAGLAQTFEWYLYLGLDRRGVDLSPQGKNPQGTRRPPPSSPADP